MIDEKTNDLHLFTNEEIIAELAWQEEQGGPGGMRNDYSNDFGGEVE